MLKVIGRNVVKKAFQHRVNRINVVGSKGLSTGDESDDAKEDQTAAKDSKPSERQKKARDARKKLDELLSNMKIHSIAPTDPKSVSINLAKPGPKRKPALQEKAKQAEGLGKNLVEAVRNVANSVEGNPELTESELLTKLRQLAEERKAGKVAATTGEQKSAKDVIAGMKIDRSRPKGLRRGGTSSETPDMRPPQSRFDLEIGQLRADARRRPFEGVSRMGERVNLFGQTPLGIFSKSSDQTPPVSNYWKSLEKRELNQLVMTSPRNAFEEMIQWTEQGKLWKFPIDNEQGIPPEEANVGFHEHVFLEHLLDDGFPKKGPIRHFMELVVVGLSKNPYITIQRKHEHIDWYRKYFAEKKELLQATGAL